MVDFEIQTVPDLDTLADRFEELRGKLADLRPLFEQFGADFYKDEKRIFNLKGPGKYQDLTEKYKRRKQKKYGFTYPILFATGRLANSLLRKNARDSIYIVKPQKFYIGTSVPYAVYHHSTRPRTKIPRRPVYFFGDDNQQMLKRWSRLVDVYIQKSIAGAFK